MAAPRKPKSGGVQKGKTKAGAASPDARVSSGANGNGRVTPSSDVIRVRAYEIFLERGDSSGDELSDWLAAEREITKTPSSHS